MPAYLFDTHTLVWAIGEPERLSPKVRAILAAGDDNVKASVVSYWELMIKRGRPSALLTDPAGWWDRNVTRQALEILPIRVAHVDQLDHLGDVHRDPFDRMLLAQCLAEDLTLISRDETLRGYKVPVLWA